MLRRKAPLSYENALLRAATLCSRCEQCSPDIIKKLSAWGLSSSDSDKVIERLTELNFLNDERFVKAYAHDKLCFSGWGRKKIQQGLWAKRLPKELIELSFDEIDDEEYTDIACQVIRAKAKSYKEWPLSRENKIKLIRYAMMRGFEYPLIADIIRNRLHSISDNI